jgi:hypothetical protein
LVKEYLQDIDDEIDFPEKNLTYKLRRGPTRVKYDIER